MEKQFVLDYNDAHEETDIDSNIGFQTAGFTYSKQYSIICQYLINSEGIKIIMKNLFSDIHTYFMTTFTIITILLFNVFGNLGLVFYGLLILYSAVFFFMNLKQRNLLNIPIFYIMVAYYVYSLIAICINGSVIRNGSPIIQLFFLSLIAYFYRKSESLFEETIGIAKILTIASLIMAGASYIVYVFSLNHQNAVLNFPSFIRDICFNVRGNIPKRMDGFGYHPNATASFCLSGAIFSIFLLTFEKEKKWIILSVINIAISILTIFIATNSRTNMIALIFFSAIYLVLYCFVANKDNKKLKNVAILIIIITCIVFLLFIFLIKLSPTIRTFIFEKVIRISSLSTASGRDSVYKIAYELGRGHRLLGYNLELLAERVAPHAHNMFLQILSYAGIPALILFCIYFFYTFYIAGKNFFARSTETREKSFYCFIFCYIACYLILGIPETAGVDGISHISLCAQLLFAYTHIIHHEKKLNLKSTQ